MKAATIYIYQIEVDGEITGNFKVDVDLDGTFQNSFVMTRALIARAYGLLFMLWPDMAGRFAKIFLERDTFKTGEKS
jgi:hypothetical protein